MIVDFQHHFTPHELMPKDLGRRKIVSYDEHGAPSFIMHWMLFDLDEHIAMMDESGIDVAFLTSAAGMCAPLDKSKLCNDAAKKAEHDRKKVIKSDAEWKGDDFVKQTEALARG